MHHHIGSTHVFHHVFSNAPCYKAVEATKHIKAFLEPKVPPAVPPSPAPPPPPPPVSDAHPHSRFPGPTRQGLYNYDARPIVVAAWQTAKRCHYVDSIEGAQYFKKLSKAQ